MRFKLLKFSQCFRIFVDRTLNNLRVIGSFLVLFYAFFRRCTTRLFSIILSIFHHKNVQTCIRNNVVYVCRNVNIVKVYDFRHLRRKRLSQRKCIFAKQFSQTTKLVMKMIIVFLLLLQRFQLNLEDHFLQVLAKVFPKDNRFNYIISSLN